MNLAQLTALVAVVDEGGFEAAAHALGVTTSAVSQRIRGLERSAGRILVSRASPVRPTEAGEELLIPARQIAALMDELAGAAEAGSGGGVGRTRLPIAVNADSLATWIPPVFDEIADWDDVSLEIRIEDEGYAHHALARGEVLGAISTSPVAAAGAKATPLGTMRYLPVVSERLAARFPEPASALGFDAARCPMLVFDRLDEIQATALARAVGADAASAAPVHFVASNEAFFAAARAGMGWGCVPELQLAAADGVGDLIRIAGLDPVDLTLYWHRWSTPIAVLDRLTDVVAAVAAEALRPASSCVLTG